MFSLITFFDFPLLSGMSFLRAAANRPSWRLLRDVAPVRGEPCPVAKMPCGVYSYSAQPLPRTLASSRLAFLALLGLRLRRRPASFLRPFVLLAHEVVFCHEVG